VVDELHVVREEVWDAMALAGGTRARPLTLAISTAAGDRDGVMWRLTEHGRAGDDRTFFYWCAEAPDGAELTDETAWAAANPLLGNGLDIEHLRSTVLTTREDVFRRFHMNLWCGQVGSWLPWGLWESRADPGREVSAGTRIVCGFDGSASSDSTALIAATVEPEPHLFVINVWEQNADPRWRVDRAEVDATVADVFDTFDVAEMVVDVFGWRSEAEGWAARWPGGRVLEMPMNAARMGPATDRAYTAIAEGKLSHDGDRRLARHVGNAVAKRTSMGDVLQKDARDSPRRIDAAVAMVLAVERAAWHQQHPRRRARVASF
jgi:phage terminase large subunit-like protein